MKYFCTFSFELTMNYLHTHYKLYDKLNFRIESYSLKHQNLSPFHKKKDSSFYVRKGVFVFD